MADQPIKLTPLGNLDKDTEYKFVKEGNYVDALDIIKQDDAGQVSGTTQPTQRNKHAFSLGEVVAQNKRYRITVVPNSGTDGNHARHAISIRSIAGDAMINYNGILDYPEVTDGTAVQFTSTITGFQQGWADTTNNNIFNVTYPTLPGQTYPVIEIELIAYDYYNYKIESVGPDPVKIECLQEAIPTDLAGPLKDIGSFDLLGDLFVFSTSQDNDPEETNLEVSGVGPIANIGGQNYYVGLITTIAFTTDHNLQVGQAISITNSNIGFLNGSFVVNQVNSNIEIGIVAHWIGPNSTEYPVTSNISGGEVITINPVGIGEIGIAQKDNQSDNWSYTRLLRSLELNYSLKHNIDCTFNRDGSRSAGYYTDDYNPPRSFYYYGSNFSEDGALTLNNSENIYDYDLIAEQSVNFSGESSAKIDFDSQLQNNGNLSPGNKYYAVRLLDQDNNATDFSTLYGPINVYENNNIATPNGAAGTDSSVSNTSKVNVIRVYDYDVESYTQCEIGILENIGGVYLGTLIGPFLLDAEETIIRHTGFEENAASLDVAEFISKLDGFLPIKAKSIREIDERLVLSNIVTVDSIDLKDWAASIKHSIVRKSLPQKKVPYAGEYELPENTFENRGYMLNETYRMGVRIKFKAFGWTDTFWVDDIKIDANSNNTANPNGDNRRINGLPNYDLTEDSFFVGKLDVINGTDPNNPSPPTSNSGGLPYDVFEYQDQLVDVFNTTYPDSQRGRGVGWEAIKNYSRQIPRDGNKNIFIPHIEFSFDLSYQVPQLGNKTLLELVEEVSFVRGVIPKSIVASGFGVLSVEAIRTFTNLDEITGANFPENSQLPTTGEKVYMEYPYWNGTRLSTSSITSPDQDNIFPAYPYRNTAYDSNNLAERFPIFFNEYRSLLSIYSNDTIYGDLLPGTKASKLLVTGVPEFYRAERVFDPHAGGDDELSNPNYLTHYMPQYQGDSYEEYDIDAITSIDNGGQMMDIETLNGDLFTKEFGSTPGRNNSLRGPVVKTSSQVLFPGTSEYTYGASTQFNQSLDRGLVVCQLFRDVKSDYPLIKNTSYISCNHSYINNTGNVQPTTRVLGGDTFTCTAFMRTRTRDIQDNFERAMGFGTVYVSQSRVNASMRSDTEDNFVFPSDTINYGSWLLAPSERKFDANGDIEGWDLGLVDQDYNQAYNLNEDIINSTTALAYTRTLGLGDYPVRVIYSIKNIEEAVIDSYKKILPLNFKDLDLTFGEIMHHENINGELFTIQPRKYQLQYFNTRGTLQGSNSGVEVLIGDGSVLSRDGQTLSSYGTQHKWGVVKGASPGGKDVIYWFNQENGLFMRFGC
jgi:hypothetical protein